MLQFNKEVDYGLQLILALMELKPSELLSLRKFSKDSHISFLFLQRIAKKLREANMIEAVKGAHGGYNLIVKPKKLTIKDVIEAIEGEYAVANCLKSLCHCPKEKTCRSQQVFKVINQHLIEYLDSLSIYDISRKAKK